MDPLLLAIPESFDTERLTIRTPSFDDVPELVTAVNESLAELQPWMPWAQKPNTVEEQQIRLRKVVARWILREELVLHLFLKNTTTLVGSSGAHHFDWAVPSCETGYWLRTRFTRQGLATEAVHGITRFLFENLKLRRLDLRCNRLNVRSAAVAQRCGFLLEGVLRNEGVTHTGELRDTMVFSKLSPDEFHRS